MGLKWYLDFIFWIFFLQEAPLWGRILTSKQKIDGRRRYVKRYDVGWKFLEGGKKAHLPYRDNRVGPVRVQKPRSDLPGFVYSTTTLQCSILLRIRRRHYSNRWHWFWFIVIFCWFTILGPSSQTIRSRTQVKCGLIVRVLAILLNELLWILMSSSEVLHLIRDCYDFFASAFAILNPLFPKSDHHLLSPYSNTAVESFT